MSNPLAKRTQAPASTGYHERWNRDEMLAFAERWNGMKARAGCHDRYIVKDTVNADGSRKLEMALVRRELARTGEVPNEANLRPQFFDTIRKCEAMPPWDERK